MKYERRKTIGVNVGGVMIGSDYPVRVQSMTNTTTTDIEASAAQSRRIAEAGGEIVRLTAQGVREAEAIGEIRAKLRSEGCDVPLVADIHFNPRAAFAAAQVTDKVRINPGNFVDPARQFRSLEYTDEEYAAELARIREALLPFIRICREHGTAVRLGVNHGSLSDRIMSRYGNTAAGMVESVMEFLRVFRDENFNQVVISMKASNVVVMVESVQRLVQAMDAEDMHYPLHLGVTEAGFGEDGRIKSAVGIGTLLSQGLGDTIRVSLSEEPEAEIPVAKKLVSYITSRPQDAGEDDEEPYPIAPSRVLTTLVDDKIGGGKVPVVLASGARPSAGDGPEADYYPEADSAVRWLEVSAGTPIENIGEITASTVLVVTPSGTNVPGSQITFIRRLKKAGINCPVIVKNSYADTEREWLQVKAGADLGAVMMTRLADGVWLEAPAYGDRNEVVSIALSILQATRQRISHTEFISCPGCGRTMFDLQTTVKRVKEATSHLHHLKIGVMGCVVNGPGEMADADYGYVGAARHKISLYRGKECVEKNIPEEEAIERLLALIESDARTER
ncbi:MAG: (E)-4-hydroxy-3-methylbut-2-enyl-diphosphate synthase [Muribaculaceae bacterium]|nr:(E)-4-hydroxy-3-methylbut-2-enyl-diphosphate synthase [Muribaculaceae bacterium]